MSDKQPATEQSRRSTSRKVLRKVGAVAAASLAFGAAEQAVSPDAAAAWSKHAKNADTTLSWNKKTGNIRYFGEVEGCTAKAYMSPRVSVQFKSTYDNKWHDFEDVSLGPTASIGTETPEPQEIHESFRTGGHLNKVERHKIQEFVDAGTPVRIHGENVCNTQNAPFNPRKA